MNSFFLGFALAASPVTGFLSSTKTSDKHSLKITGKHSLKHHSSHRRHHRSQQHTLATLAENSTTSASQASASSINHKVCQDSPSDWKSKTGATCGSYEKFEWCTEEGHHGEGWTKEFGDFDDWASTLGRGAPEACCACGGGMEMGIQRTALGGICANGTAIRSEQVCRDVASSIGAGFAMAAHWPIGQPTGCHTDAEGKQVWLNTSPKGTTPHPKYAVLCATDMKLRHFGAESEEAEDDEEAEEDEEGDEEEDKDKDKAEEDKDKAEDKDKDEQAAVVRGGSKDKTLEGPDQQKHEDPESAKLRQAVVSAHAALAHNLKRRVEIGIELQGLSGNYSMNASIDARVASLSNETQSPVLAEFLGDMWKEQRRYEIPPYTDALKKEEAAIEKEAVALQAAYDSAKKALDAKAKEEAF